MRRFVRYFVLSVGCLAVAVMSACKAAPPAAPPAPEFRPTATIKEIMDSMVDPTADVLWESVATVVDKTGIVEKRPRTDEEWAVVKRSAVTLIEATNLLLINPRTTGKPGDKSENPNIELAPEQIDALRAKDVEEWKMFVKGLYDATLPALNAINAKDADKLLDAGEGIDTACENCHLHYWYPPGKNPENAPSIRKSK